MKFGLIVYGSNGDVEMFVSLALGLINKGHEVELFIITINNRDYTFLNKNNNLKVYQKQYHAEIRNKQKENLEFWNEAPENQFYLMDSWYKTVLGDIVGFSYQFCQNCDIVVGPQHILELSCIAEKFNTPYVSVRAYAAYIRTRFEKPYWLSFYNSENIDELWDMFESYENKSYKRYINKFRKLHGLDKINNVVREVIDSKFLNVIGYSRHLHKPQPDWGTNFKLCGYFKPFNHYINWQVPAKLAEFMAGTEKPVFMTVGTMLEYENNPVNIHRVLLETAYQLDRKVIIHSKWDNEEPVDRNVFKLSGFIDYSKILGMCSLAVHHGGVGTVHIATEAACPSIIIEYGCEQPFNAHILRENGLSKGSIHRKELTTEKLTTLVKEALETPSLMANAKLFSKRLSEENGVSIAIETIEEKYNSYIKKNYS
ncbi:MAG: glycosyltransferase family 1 protein [Bacteroidales bacterium]|nr:glycosyltransferase family 1 protein [Bacteroidales bacterium]